MMEIIYYFVMMLILFILTFMLALSMYYMNVSFMYEWLIMEVNSLNMEFVLLLDWMSLLFISLIILISSMIIMYSYEYMYGNKFIKRFMYLVVLFVLSMVFMVISPNIISIMIGWDGLGLVSYCLVIFYQNYLSYNSGMVTVLVNRIGDVGLLMSISLLMIKGSWSMYLIESKELVLIMMLMLASITKSAQIPFSVWLPMAMAAPTPVSALVHSSTLVTAGVYLLIRFNKFFMYSELNKILLVLAVLTMFMSGLMAILENDLKKIIALSTLSQLGLMMVILSFGMSMISFFHLLTHAIFKSMLFMCAGVIIHSMYNLQDIRNMGSLIEGMPFISMSFFISSMSLVGFPFMAGFYSKDYIMELIYSFNMNLLMIMIILMSFIFTVLYSFRLFYYLFFSTMKFMSYNNLNEIKFMNLSMMILIILSVMIGSILNWLFFFDYNILYLDFNIKMLTLSVCILGILLEMCLVVYNFLSYLYYLGYYLSNMLFLNYLYKWIYKPILVISNKLIYADDTWIEFMMKGSIGYLNEAYKDVINFSINSIIYFFIFMILLMVVMF
uniref:NADH-ubiquinone oxidoreductase chain 5 n=1 Tax=Pristomyrmex punctatus TaxID=507543 RepID=E5RQ01_9HYME|nr:NADH dehydrogenase subunit 5 [Pristomyrmex punctatus]BAJ53354.1 NADH dehydrogenase subunit 5 [Pristomyrmex punctatus]BAJ53367.1 NADH dehydrogenase subunit 5 [Pristomyrmex punctatus]